MFFVLFFYEQVKLMLNILKTLVITITIFSLFFLKHCRGGSTALWQSWPWTQFPAKHALIFFLSLLSLLFLRNGRLLSLVYNE